MSCCGQKRAGLVHATSGRSIPRESVQTGSREPTALSRWLEYTGSGAVTVRGAVTGRLYRFDQPGVRVEVAYVDSHALLAEMLVRPVKA